MRRFRRRRRRKARFAASLATLHAVALVNRERRVAHGTSVATRRDERGRQLARLSVRVVSASTGGTTLKIGGQWFDSWVVVRIVSSQPRGRSASISYGHMRVVKIV